MWVRVWVRKAWKVRTKELPAAFAHFCWPHLLHKQLNNEEESPNVWGRRENRVKCPRRRKYSAQPTSCSFSRTGGKRLASEELCFLPASRWQHGSAVRDQLSSWMPLLLLQDSERFSGHLVLWEWLMVLPIHCTPRVIKPAVFWRLERRPEPLSDGRGCNILDIISLQRRPRGLFVVLRVQWLAECFKGGEGKPATTTLNIWGNWIEFMFCQMFGLLWIPHSFFLPWFWNNIPFHLT